MLGFSCHSQRFFSLPSELSEDSHCTSWPAVTSPVLDVLAGIGLALNAYLVSERMNKYILITGSMQSYY